MVEMERIVTGQGIDAVVRRNPADGTVTLEGRISALGAQPMTIEWRAAAPVTRGISFAGSGQPYPNKEIAYEGSPNSGSTKSMNGSFNIKLKDIPAGYYSRLGSIYVPPMVEFHATNMGGTRFATALRIADTAAPYRWISGAPATMRPDVNTEESTGRAMYYFGREELPIFTIQEAQLSARAYPGDMTGRGIPDAEDARPWTYIPAPA
jgi:hypothetical protein